MPSELDPSDVPAWPVVAIEMRTDGRIRVDDDMFVVPDGADMRQTAIAAVAATASLIGRPVRAEAHEPDGTVWPLIVTPDGQALAAGSGRRPPPTARRRGFRGGVLRRPSAQTSPPMPASPPALSPPQGPAVPLPPPAPGMAPAQPAESGQSGSPVASAQTSTAPSVTPTPEPDASTHAALDRILSELRDGRPAAARSRAQNLVDRLAEQRGGADAATHAAQEVLAYTTFVAGDAARAARMYAELAVPHMGTGPMDAHGERLADNAHFCWCRADNSPDAHEAGARILALRTAGWGADSAPARAARRKLAALDSLGGR